MDANPLRALQTLGQSVWLDFISRIDTALDAMLVQHPELRGEAAIASAKLAGQIHQEIFRNYNLDKADPEGHNGITNSE